MRDFRYPLTRRPPQPQRGGRRQPGATPRGPATASYTSPERAAQDLRGGCVAKRGWVGPPFQGLGWLFLWDAEPQGFALGCLGLPRWGAGWTPGIRSGFRPQFEGLLGLG